MDTSDSKTYAELAKARQADWQALVKGAVKRARWNVSENVPRFRRRAVSYREASIVFKSNEPVRALLDEAIGGLQSEGTARPFVGVALSVRYSPRFFWILDKNELGFYLSVGAGAIVPTE